MQVNGPTVANSVRLSGATHRALQRPAQLERRSLAGQAAYLPEQALAVEQRVRRALAVGGHRARSTRRGATVDEEDEGEEEGRR
jgi:hypothetical protein